MKSHKAQLVVVLSVVALTGLVSTSSHARQPAARQSPPPAASPNQYDQGQDVDVERIKKRYWSRGDESDLGVVQNRLYSKEGKVEIGGFGGFVNSDPFLTVYNAGGTLGYHFTEYLGVDVLAWKSFSSPSSALNLLRSAPAQGGVSADANVNNPKGLIGGEAEWSILYGKLSLLGKAIIHYDLHLRGGAGITYTENGNYFTGIVGIGQQFYVNQFTTLTVDFRLTPYHEDIVNRIPQVNGVPEGQVINSQTNWANTITLGLSFLI